MYFELSGLQKILTKYRLLFRVEKIVPLPFVKVYWWESNFSVESNSGWGSLISRRYLKL